MGGSLERGAGVGVVTGGATHARRVEIDITTLTEKLAALETAEEEVDHQEDEVPGAEAQLLLRKQDHQVLLTGMRGLCSACSFLNASAQEISKNFSQPLER